MRIARQKGKASQPRLPSSSLRRRGRWKKGLFALLTTAGFFVLLELVLTACGVQPISFHSDPYVGFSSYSPLYVPDSDGGGTTMVTARNKRAWFNRQRFPRKKPAGAYRVFCLGGSTTYGRPYNDVTSFSGWLREFLPAADGSREWEVINAGGVSYASYRVARLMEELIRYEPDLFVIYCGHNEFLERRTYSSIIETPQSVRNATALLSRTRTYSALRYLVRGTDRRAERDKNGDGKPFKLPSEVKAVLDDAIGPDAYARDLDQQRQIVAHFRFNLHRMIEIARSAGAKVVLIVPADNLRSCTPFKSQHRDGLGELQLARFQELYAAATSMRDDRPAESLRLANAALAIDDRHAHLQYLRGEVLWRLHRPAEARSAFVRARDEDVCPLRALSTMTKVVRDVAKRDGVPLVDFEDAIAAKSQHGVPGEDWFLDHVHPTIAGHRLLAELLLQKMRGVGILASGTELNDQKKRQVVRRVESRIDRHAHAEALKNLSKVLGWAGKQEDAQRLALRAVALIPDDPEAQYQAGNAYVHLREFDRAVERFEASLKINPRSAATWYGLGVAYESKRDVAKAIASYRQSLEIDKNFAKSHYNLAGLLGARGDEQLAVRHYAEALRINPNDFNSQNNLGVIAARKRDYATAEKHFRRALKANPQHAESLRNLGRIHLERGDAAAAVKFLSAALRLRPNDFAAAFLLAGIYATHPTASLRNGKAAVLLATRCARMTSYKEADVLAVLAAAYAETGDFANAVKWQQAAIDLLPAEQQKGYAARLAAFRQGRPWREPAKTTPP